MKKGIIKSDVSDNLPIFFSIQLTKDERKALERVFNNSNIISFEEQLSLHHGRHIDFNGTVNVIYDTFRRILTDIYDVNFSIWENILEDKDNKAPWISKGLKKSSKKKQKLYIKFLKTKTLEDEFKYKTYKSLLGKLRKKLK